MMFIETSQPRTALIETIVRSIHGTLIERNISLADYLKEIAMFIEVDEISSGCIVLKDDKPIVFLPPNFCVQDVIQLVARIRLRHLHYYNLYSEEMRNILDQEVQIFSEYYNSVSARQTCCLG